MDDLLILTRRCRAVVEDALGLLRAQPPTADSRAHQIQALAILRTLDEWLTRTPFPEQPPRLARMAHDLAAAVFGEAHPRTVELRRWSAASPVEDGAPTGSPAGPLRVCVSCRRSEPAAAASTCTECGSSLKTVDASSVVEGRYVLLRELGRGGMGVVHEAIDILLERPAAVKLLGSDGAFAGVVPGDIRKEATALAAVRNEHVVQVYAFGIHGRGYFLAMERVLGRDLAAILDQHEEDGSTLPVPLAVAILGRIASGVAAVHEAGLLHRDLKPSNILIEERTGRAVLVDFGLALRKPSNDGAFAGGGTPGTPLYMAPELVGGGDSQAAGRPQGRWNASDIYALGCTAFEMLTGKAPFLGQGLEAALQLRRTGPPPRASSVRASVAAFDGPLLRALATAPHDRHGTADEFARDLERALQVWLHPAPTQPAMPRVSSQSPAPDPEPLPASLSEGARVLIVDDDPVFLMLATRCISLAFSQAPVRIDVVASSDAAIAAARRTMPDLVILDYCMPREDGVGALTRLRGLPGGDRPRVVVVSATVPSLGQWHFEALGVKDFVSKPVRPQAFIALVADIAARAGWQNPRVNAMRQDLSLARPGA